jgi:hypothetical protein
MKYTVEMTSGTKIYDDRFRHSSNIKVISSAV